MSHDFDNIPAELRELKQWVIWKYEDVGAKKPTKVPYDAKEKNKLASVNDQNTWSNYSLCVECFNRGDCDGIGFVFTPDDPYTFIDLDSTEGDPVAQDRQIKIFHEFDSYSEISPSGKGLHIIIRGKVPAGRRRSFIEIYSSQRYATMTGVVYHKKPIEDRQSLLSTLYDQMGAGGAATTLFKGDDNEKYKDKEIVEQAKTATNGDKFFDLYRGSWQARYPSQSEADFALIDIIAFYTQNRNQISRIFRSSNLGSRDKAKRQDYINWMINKSFDRMLPQLDFDGFKNSVQDTIANNKISIEPANPIGRPIKQLSLEVETEQPLKSSVPIPPGLLGELAQFIYASAPRPVPEIALAGAIGLMAGICGRAYNVSNTGLNQYILLLAKTGMGKEGMRSGIDKLMNAIKLTVPTSSNFIGPSHIASGQALVKYIHKKSQCFVSILGEFGHTLRNISNVHANSHDIRLKQELLDIYQKSGHQDVYRSSIQADLEKSTEATNSPALSVLAESNPHTFYEALTEEMIVEGLLPRFLLIEYNGLRVDESEHHSMAVPPFHLTERLASLVGNVEMVMHAKRVINIKFSDEANAIAKDFDKYATNIINRSEDEVTLNLWNRAHLKAIKFAGLIAVGVNMADPVIEVEHLQLAINMVQNDIKALYSKFEKGEIGTSSSEAKQLSETIRILKTFVLKDFTELSGYLPGKQDKALHDAKVIPYAYLNRRLVSTAAFRLDRGGATTGIKRALQTLLDSDKIREVGKLDLAQKFNTTQRAFIIADPSILIS